VGTWTFAPLHVPMGTLLDLVATILKRAAMKVSEISVEVITGFVDAAAAGYSKSPQYHNWAHAVDVTHTMFKMQLEISDGYHSLFSELEDLSLLVSAACHDIGHPGLTNDFLVLTAHELALRYNDTSPLENMHCARLFEIMKNPAVAVFGTLSKEQYKEVRTICIEAILSTDKACLVSTVKTLQMFCEMNSGHLTCAWDLACGEEPGLWPPAELEEALREPGARKMLRNVMLQFSNISSPTKPWDICREWAFAKFEEFFTQGDQLQKMALPVPPLHDRRKTNRPLSQIGYIEFFVSPLVFATVKVLAPLGNLEMELLANARCWLKDWGESQGDEQGTGSDSEDFAVRQGQRGRRSRRSPSFPHRKERCGSGGPAGAGGAPGGGNLKIEDAALATRRLSWHSCPSYPEAGRSRSPSLASVQAPARRGSRAQSLKPGSTYMPVGIQEDYQSLVNRLNKLDDRASSSRMSAMRSAKFGRAGSMR